MIDICRSLRLPDVPTRVKGRWQINARSEWRLLALSEIEALLGQPALRIDKLATEGILLPTINLEYTRNIYLGFFTYFDCLDAAIRLLVSDELSCSRCSRIVADHVIEAITDDVIYGVASPSSIDCMGFPEISARLQILVDNMWARFLEIQEFHAIGSIAAHGVPLHVGSSRLLVPSCCSCQKTVGGHFR